MIVGTPREEISYPNRRTDNHTGKKFLTNSDKSIFNLKWEVGGVAEKRNHYQKRPTPHNESMPIHNSGTSYEASPKPNVHYYYPPVPDTPKRMNRPPNRIKQNERPVNLRRNPNELRIEHHYVDSPSEAKKLIDDLRRKGFFETGITTSGVYPNHKKK